MNRQKGTVVEWLIILVIIASIGYTIYGFIFGFEFNTGNGTQVGYVSAVEKEGTFFKTGTAYIKPDLSSTQEDIYCVSDPQVYDQLQQASIQKVRVEVAHYSVLHPAMWQCGGESAIIKSVTILK